MSTTPNLHVERRRSIRVSPRGTVVVSAGKRVHRGRIGNISSGGLLAVTAERPPADLQGAAVDVELRLDAASSEWQHLAGRVCRVGADAIAVELREPPASFAQLIEATLTASDEHERVRTVVIVDANPARRRMMADAFRVAQCAVLEVSMPLEAVVRLGESQFDPDLIAIADSMPSTTGDELRRFVEREHPRATVVTIGDAAAGPPGHDRWLSASAPPGELIARIRALLGR